MKNILGAVIFPATTQLALSSGSDGTVYDEIFLIRESLELR